MRQSTLTFVGMLALAIAGCGSDKDTALTGSAPQPAAKVFDKPTVSQPPSTISAVPVLIQPTNGNQRAKQVQKGRQDPFAGLFAQAGLIPTGATTSGTVPQLPTGATTSGTAPQLPTGATTSGTAPQLPTGATTPRRQTVAVRSSPPRSMRTGSNSIRQSNPNRSTGSQSGSGQSPASQSGSSQSGSSQTIPLPPVTPDTFPSVAPPPPQEPDLASNVAVSGVIQIGNETQAIVQVPNEGTSRYVRVGQRLSNGQVLVKRIEMNQGSDPVVILEQYGIEVARAVGEKPVNSAQAGTSTDSNQSQPSPDASTDPAQTSTPNSDTGTPAQITTPGDASTGTPSQITTPGDASTGTPSQITTPSDGGASEQPGSDTPAAPLDTDSEQQNSDTPTTNTSPVAPSLENAPDGGLE